MGKVRSSACGYHPDNYVKKIFGGNHIEERRFDIFQHNVRHR